MTETKLRQGAHLYGPKDVGCFADGTFGHNYIRSGLSILLLSLFPENCAETTELRIRLNQEMSDDASEEDDAINLLNDHACEGAYFEMVDGDLMLSVEGSDDDT